MAVSLMSENKKYICQAADTKPTLTASDVGARCYITDTGDDYIWGGAAWVLYPSLIQAYTHVFSTMYHAIIQGTWVIVTYGSIIFNTAFYNSSNAVNDEIQYKLYHKAGAYTIEIAGITDVDKGISTVSIDGVSQGTIDWYAASIVYNVLKTLPVVFTTSGTHTINLKITSKNTGSSGYMIYLSYIRIKAT